MTDPVPAIALGLPSFDRRSFIATLAAAGVMMGATLPAAEAGAADHPDAALLDLEARHAASLARRQAFDLAMEEAFDDLVPAEIPDALCWRRSDFLSVCFDRSRDCACYGNRDEARYVYDSKETVDRFRAQLARAVERTATVLPENRCAIADDREIARLREIIEAFELYEARDKAAEDACGYTAAADASDREDALGSELLDSIIRTPALTPDGVVAKARAAGSVYPGKSYLEATLAAFTGESTWEERQRLLSFSLTIDALNLGNAAPASLSERSAA